MSRAERGRETAGGILNSLFRYLRRRRGAISPLMALALVPIVGALGMATEAGNWWLTQKSLQHAADSAAFAAAIDASNNYGSGYPTSTPTGGSCSASTATTSSTSWYCQAKAAATAYGFTTGASSVTVTPVAGTSVCPSTMPSRDTGSPPCYQVTIQKYVAFNLLQMLGYHGTGGTNTQLISASAIVAPPGPPVDFCVLTDNGDLSASGSPKANLQNCDTFSNGNTSCTGNGLQAGESFATGTSSGCATGTPGINRGGQLFECDHYGKSTQAFGTGATATTKSCPGTLDVSDNLPAPPSGCTEASSTATDGTLNNQGQPPNYANANIISQATLNGTATTGATLTSATITAGGVSQTYNIIQVCGNATLAGTAPVSSAGTTTTPTPCASTLKYTTTTANLLIIVYNGTLYMNGCTMQNNEPTTSGGGMTVAFAPIPGNTTCASMCYLYDHNGAASDLVDAGPLSGPLSGIAILQSGNFAADSGCPNGNKVSGVDWCAAGNQPTLNLQGLIYMPNTQIQFSGAIDKFNPTGALTCIGMVVNTLSTNGTGAVFSSDWTGGATKDCGSAGVTLPTVSGTHLFAAALVA